MGDDRETVASRSSERSEGQANSCDHCGSAIDTSDWYPVIKERDPDGSLRFQSFCSEECQAAWLEDRSGDD